jgi:hypothetical protein
VAPFRPKGLLNPILNTRVLKQELRAGAWSGELGAASLERGAAGAGAGPTRDPGKHLIFILSFFSLLFSLFVCGAALHNIRNFAAQPPQAQFASSSFLCSARSRKEEGCRRLLLLLCVARKKEKKKAMAASSSFFCSATPEGAAGEGISRRSEENGK